MKLLRWAVAGASVYGIYKYSIGKKAKGEDVLTSAEKAIADLEEGEAAPEPATEERPKRKRVRSAKSRSQ